MTSETHDARTLAVPYITTIHCIVYPTFVTGPAKLDHVSANYIEL